MNYYYRGMSSLDLMPGETALDPAADPFGAHRELFTNYCLALKSLCDGGFEFDVVDTCINPLSRIVGWPLRDLASASIDFTPDYEDAASYAANFAGSQLKHNLWIIVNTLPVKLYLTEEVRNDLTAEAKRPHRPVVLKVCSKSAVFTPTAFGDIVKLARPLKYGDIEEIIEL